VRLFFALWPPAKTAHVLAQWAHRLDGVATRPESIHLTLAFLGETDPGLAHNAASRVQARRHALPIEEARYWKRNKIVWVGPREMPPALAELVTQLHKALRDASFTLEDRPFAAHVTLLRKAPPPPPQALPPLEWPVNEFLLVRSRTSPKGSTYEPLQRYSLS
jgi:2'-5' RNA ligase